MDAPISDYLENIDTTNAEKVSGFFAALAFYLGTPPGESTLFDLIPFEYKIKVKGKSK